MSKNKKIIASVATALLLFGIYIVVDQKSKRNQNNTSTQNATSTISNNTDGSNLVIGAEGTGQYKIERVPVNEGRETPTTVQTPDLSKPVIFNSSLNLSEESKNAISQKIDSIKNTLKADPQNLTAWLDLGVYQKMAGDYNAALASWKYISQVADKDYISFGNMGDLYAYYLKDNGMAETSYLKAIENAPLQAYLYVRLAEIYKNVFGDIVKAKALIDKGLEAIPGDKTLTEYRATL